MVLLESCSSRLLVTVNGVRPMLSIIVLQAKMPIRSPELGERMATVTFKEALTNESTLETSHVGKSTLEAPSVLEVGYLIVQNDCQEARHGMDSAL